MISRPEDGSSPALADWGELRFLDWVRRRFPVTKQGKIALSIGDDAAHLRLGKSKDLLVTTDALIEDVHFRHEWISPRDLGFKAMVSNLSDLAAMAAQPDAAFLSLGVPSHTPIAQLKAFFLGLRSASNRWHCPLAGGDLVRAPQWTINLTLLGSPAFKDRVVTRSTARPGHTVFVTGWPGESAAGLDALQHNASPKRLLDRHRRPLPRLAEAKILARLCPDLAMIDVSDGVASEALHLATSSQVRLEINVANLPISRALKSYTRVHDLDPTALILNGGEDYELLFTTNLSEHRIRKAFATAKIRTPVTAIGKVVNGQGLGLLDSEGRPMKLNGSRFEHFA